MSSRRVAALFACASLAGCSRPASADAPAVVEVVDASVADAALTTDAPRAKLLFVGDLSLGLHVGYYLEERARGGRLPRGVDARYPLGDVTDRVRAADLAIGNLECVVSPIGAPIADHNVLRAPVLALDVLRDAGFDVLSVANNHALDFGPIGYDDMLARIEQAGLLHTGSALRAPPPEPFVVREVNGLRVAVLAFHEVSDERATADVRTAKARADLVVVMNHWGLEDHAGVMPYQRRLGRALIDAGADLVVGTHAHVLQPVERYRDKLLVYGLGNFVFSGMGCDEAHRVGMLLEASATRAGIEEVTLARVRIDDTGAPRWLDGGAAIDAEKATFTEPPVGRADPAPCRPRRATSP